LYRRLRKTTRYGSPPLHERTFSRSLPRKRGRCREAIGMGFAHHCGTQLSLWHHFANSSIAKSGPKWLCERPLALTPRGKARSLLPRFELHDCRTNPTTIDFRQHSLYFWPLPNGQGSFRPTFFFPRPFPMLAMLPGFRSRQAMSSISAFWHHV
jgi:hypothetical protein